MGPFIAGFHLILILHSCTVIHGTLYKKWINLDEIKDLFDENGCITGHLTMAGSAPVPVGTDNEGSSAGGQSTQDEPATSDGSQSVLGKEKTPMCLVNELARYNKIEHQYRLTSEDGPPHKKKFTVTLKLGNEEYTAEGASIKKAQHAAAGIALKSTTYKHPPPKSSRQSRGSKSNITPTVELNALAMKRGEPTVYTLVESPQFHQYTYNHSHRGMYTQPYNDHFTFPYGRGKPNFRGGFNRVDPRFYGPGNKAPLYKVVVKVGEREFSGEGNSAQAARHDAASKALQLLHSLPLDDTCPANSTICGGLTEQETELKSPISLVHEIALKRNLPVLFEVISEKGQPHMKTFVTRCCVGDKFETTGEGNGKKISKKRAAEKMLEQLRTLPPTTTVTAPGCASALARAKRKATTGKKKSRNIIKETPISQETKYDERDNSDEMNPISRLIQIQQAKKEREPVYTLREERGLPRRREFIMEVTVGKHSYIGSGPNKKVAKRNAAEGLLQQLGYASPTLSRSGHQLPQSQSQQSQSQPSQQQHKVRFSDEKPEGGVSGRQLVPGLILMKDNKATNNGHKPGTGVNLKATIAKEYLSEGSSPTADALAGVKRQTKNSSVRPTEQLAYLASVLNFQVQFSDFPKGNHSEFLTLVSLDTDPPQVCHGAGATIDLSHEQAALNALRSLSKVGLDSITPAKKEATTTPQPVPKPEPGLYIDLKEETPYVNGK